MGSTARSPRVRARVTPHRGQGESLVPLYTRESVSLSPLSGAVKLGSTWGQPAPPYQVGLKGAARGHRLRAVRLPRCSGAS